MISGCKTTNSYLILSGLDEFFANIGKNLLANFNTSVDANNLLYYLGEPSPFLFCFVPVKEDVIQTALITLKNLSPGYDEMPTAVDKEYFYLMWNVKTKTCNGYLLYGCFLRNSQLLGLSVFLNLETGS